MTNATPSIAPRPTAHRVLRGRNALLVGAALFPLAMGSAAYAQTGGSTVVLEEGRTPTPIALGAGDDRVVVDLSRLNGDTGVLDLSGLTDSPLTDAGGLDTVWLRATSSQTRNVNSVTPRNSSAQQYVRADSATGTPFDGGTVYEASGNDTVLRLENKSRTTDPKDNPLQFLNFEPLRLAGDGTVVVSFSVSAANQTEGQEQAIRVEQGASASGGDGKLAVVIEGDVGGDYTNPDGGLIDVRNAASLTLAMGARVGGNLGGTVIEGGAADIDIKAGTSLYSRSGSNATATLVRSSGKVTNSTRIALDGPAGSAGAEGIGIRLEGGRLYNILTEGSSGTGSTPGNYGEIVGGENAVWAFNGANYIENYAEINAKTGAAIRTGSGSTVLRNTVWNFSKGGSRLGNITGGMIDGTRVAYQGAGSGTDVVINSGTIDGEVDLGIGDDMFLYTGATTGVTGGAIKGGDGLDGYGKSFSVSATHTLNNNILDNGNSGFELHGIEANGAGVTVTVTAAETLDAGLMLTGPGAVINTANITDNSGTPGIYVRDVALIERGLRFTNRGSVQTVGRAFYGQANLATFTNEGALRSSENHGALINVDRQGASIATFVASNSGTIESGGDAHDAFSFQTNATGEAGSYVLDLTNTGTIRNTGDAEAYGASGPSAVSFNDISSAGGRYRLANSGAIEATGRGAHGVEAFVAHLDAVNSKTISASGPGSIGAAFNIAAAPGAFGASTFINTGTVSANGGAWASANDVGVSAGVMVGLDGMASFDLTNGGTIEATGSGSVAIYASGGIDGNVFKLTNAGNIVGRAQTVFGDEATPSLTIADGVPLAGAIHTYRTIDAVENQAGGLIQGNVDLGELDDVFRNDGRVDGDVRLGSGSDTYIFSADGSLTGMADGGSGSDRIRIDFAGSGAKKINASQFQDFETLTSLDGTLQTGSVSVYGNIDTQSWLISNLILNVEAADTLSSAAGGTGDTLQGGDGNETVNNHGSIAGGLSMGAGDDTLNNSGSIGFDVHMGDGNDTVTNSGTIHGNLDLGSGDDRYEALGGLVTGTIDGGAGDNDIFVFRMNGSSGSIPGGFINFESFGAYGPGTLTLALNQDYNTIELLEGANLALQDGAGTVDLIKGDDTAQVVTIEDADFTGGVSLGGGDDTLSINLAGALAGQLDGGAGTDTLNLTLTAPSTINDLFNFEIVNALGASPLTLTGTLGAGQQINFDGSDNRLVITEGAVFQGNANGGAGTDTLEIATGSGNSRTIVAGQLASFEILLAKGQGTLALNGERYRFDQAEIEGDLTIGNGASLASDAGVAFTGNGDHRLTLEGTGTVDSPVKGGAGFDTLAFNLGQGQTRDLSSVGTLSDFEALASAGAGTLNIDRDASYQQVLMEGGNLSIAGGRTLTTAFVKGGALADTITVNAGATLAADVDLGAGNDTVNNYGTIDGDLNLGEGNDRYIARLGGVVTGTIDGGDGDNTFIFNLAGGVGSIPSDVLNFNSFGAYGPGTLNVNLDGGQVYQNLELLEGANLILSGSSGSVGHVIGDDSVQSVTIDGGLTGGVSLGGGDDSLAMQLSGLLDGALDGGAGTDTLNLKLTGAATIKGMFGFEIANISGIDPLTLTGDLGAGQQINFAGDADNELIIGAGVKFEGTVNGGGGHDVLRVQSGAADSRTVVASQIVSFEDLVSEGEGTLALTGGNYAFDSVRVDGGNFELGENVQLVSEGGVTFDGADNRFTLGSGAAVNGLIDGGAGNDTLALIQGTGTTRLLSAVQQAGFERLESSGAGELRIDQNATFANGVSLDGGSTQVMAGSRLVADVIGGAGADRLIVGGVVEGNVDLGAGDDTLVVTTSSGITGTVTGGDGMDRLSFNTTGTYAAPTLFDGTGYTSFEAFEIAGGVISVAGESSWTNVSISGGRLIGQAGSVISSASAIQVAKGATFGSAGTVNADINVAGILSPGASPGTMTVNGNVNFAAGSNLLLEVSPEVSDLLAISGKLTIADGAAVDITGVLHGTPGNTLDLIVAQGGITGRFTTINKSSHIFGFVVQNGNKLQIQSEFLNDEGYPGNVQASIDYANVVLRAGYGVQAFTAALPRLVDAQGAINQQAFGQLTPEAYGSAIQLGEENSLLILDGVRAAKAGAGNAGLYSFGQFLAGQADVNAANGSGAGASHISDRGFLGGLGYGFGEGAQIGAFIGGLDGKQTVRALGAKTKIDALAGGMFADAAFDAIGLHGLVAVSGGKAETRRDILVSGGTGKARYDLTSWVADLGVDYQVKLGAWAITPKLGVSYVHTNRGAAREQGLGDFNLTVDKGSKSSWYGEAAVAASGSFDAGGIRFAPYAQLGMRQLLGDAGVGVSGSYSGADAGIVVEGIERERTSMRLAIGLGVDVTEGVRLQAGYTGEFAGTKRDSVTGGLAVRF